MRPHRSVYVLHLHNCKILTQYVDSKVSQSTFLGASATVAFVNVTKIQNTEFALCLPSDFPLVKAKIVGWRLRMKLKRY